MSFSVVNNKEDAVTNLVGSSVGSSLAQTQIETQWQTSPSKILTFKENEFLFREGQWPQGIYFIRSGAVKVIVNRTLTRGRMHSPEYVSQVLGAGDLIGHKSVLRGSMQGESAKAMKPTEVQVYSMEGIQKIMKGPHTVEKMIFTQMLHDLEMKEKNSQLHYLASVQERIAYQLSLLANKFGVPHDDGLHLNLKLTRNELAQLAGTINESLSRHLTEFKNEGILDLKGKEIVVKNMGALMQRSGNF